MRVPKALILIFSIESVLYPVTKVGVEYGHVNQQDRNEYSVLLHLTLNFADCQGGSSFGQRAGKVAQVREEW